MDRILAILIIIAMIITFVLIRQKINADATTNTISAIFGK